MKRLLDAWSRQLWALVNKALERMIDLVLRIIS